MSFIRNRFVVIDPHWYLALVLFSSLVYIKIQGQVSMLPQGTFPNGAAFSPNVKNRRLLGSGHTWSWLCLWAKKLDLFWGSPGWCSAMSTLCLACTRVMSADNCFGSQKIRTLNKCLIFPFNRSRKIGKYFFSKTNRIKHFWRKSFFWNVYKPPFSDAAWGVVVVALVIVIVIVMCGRRESSPDPCSYSSARLVLMSWLLMQF